MSSDFRYIRKAPRIAVAFVAEPMETWIRFHAKFANFGSSRRLRCSYVVDPDWDRRLHEMLGAPWPCREAAEFWTLWPEVIGALTAQGMRIGPATFGVWNDGEPELVRAVWCLTRHLRPTKVVETGVARGLTSRFILEALKKTKQGIFGASTSLHCSNHSYMSRSVPPSVTALRTDGPILKAQARGAFPGCFRNSAKSTCSSTTAPIPTAMSDLNWSTLTMP